MKPRLSIVLPSGVLLALAGCAEPPPPATAPSASPPGVDAPAGAGAASITARDMYTRIAFLASDALRGRDTPSPGLDSAAAYLVREYQRLGLEPAGENGSFYQHYPLGLFGLDTATVHFGTVDGAGQDNRMLAYGADFLALPGSLPSAGAEMRHGRLLYLGRLGEGELPGREYRGELPVVTLPGMPDRAWFQQLTRLRRAAAAAGATALVVAADSQFPAPAFQQFAAQMRRPQRGYTAPTEIPVFVLSERAWRTVAQRAAATPTQLATAGATPLPLAGIAAHFAADFRAHEQSRAPNVAAVLRGSDPALRGEYVVLSAHLDHVGVGRPVNGDSIYNGADDDASGTSALVEVAEALASLPAAQRPRRSVIFLHVSGEEKGLLGSRWYTDHPTVPIRQSVANLNLDMIGRNAPDSVVVIGKAYSSLGQVIDAVGRRHPELGLTVADDLWPEERFFFRSDHFNFARKEIPALFFFTGVHADYHRPSDEVEKIDADKAARIARLVFYTVQEIGNAPTRPTWDPRGLEEVRGMTR